MAQQNRREVTPGQQQGQSDPAQNNPQNNDPPGTPPKSLFNISPELLSKLSPEVIEQMNKERQDWEATYTQLRQGETEQLRTAQKKANDLEVMLNDPGFFQEAFNKVYGNTQQPGQSQQPQNDPFSGFGEEADRVRAFAGAINQDMEGKFQGMLDSAIAPLRQQMVQTQKDREMVALTEYAEKNNLPHPSTVEAKMDMYRRRDPSMSFQVAYQASLNLDAILASRQKEQQPQSQPQSQPQGQPQDQPQTPPPVGMIPSGGTPQPSGGAVPLQDAVAEASKRRKAGDIPNIAVDFRKGMAESITEYNRTHGTNVTLDDLE